MRVDPGTGLGINGVDMLCYGLDDAKRSQDDKNTPELLPYGYCVGTVDKLHVWLKVNSQVICVIEINSTG